MSHPTGRECEHPYCRWCSVDLDPVTKAPLLRHSCVADESSWEFCPRAIRAERDVLRSALEWCTEQVFEGCDIYGGDFQDEMVKRGIMVSEPAPDDYKAEWDTDKWFVLNWCKRGQP